MTAKKYLAAAVVAALAVNAADAAEKVKFSVGGDIQSVFSTQFVQSRPAGDNTNKKIDHTNVRQDAYIRFGADTVLDNGLKVGAKADFQAVSGDLAAGGETFNPQEVYLTVGGKFGDVYLGRARSAAAQSHVYLPSAGVPGMGIDDANINIFGQNSNLLAAPDTTTDAARSVTGEFAQRVAYYTPRVQGLRFGVSYTPNGNNTSLHTAGYTNRADSGVANSEVSVGANYSRKLGQVAVDGSAGYTFARGATFGVVDPNSVNTIDATSKSPKAYQAGLALGYKGFTLGGAYGEAKYNLATATTSGNNKQRTYGAGLKYENGPWTYGVSGLQQDYSVRLPASGAKDSNRTRMYEAGVSYILG